MMQVSVVIPAYNAAGTLQRAVRSCIEQGNVVGEIILVDNRSTDETSRVATELSEQYGDRLILESETKQGSSPTRNRGIDRAGFPWIQFLDADDELLPGKIERQLNLLTSNTDWVMGTGVVRSLDDRIPDRTLQLAADPWKGIVYNGGLGDMNSSLFRRKKLVEVGGFAEDLVNGIDMDLYVRLLLSGVQWVHDIQPGAIYYDHDGDRLSRRRPEQLVQEELRRKVLVANHLASSQPDFYRRNQGFYQAAILRGIRQVFTVDPKAGGEAYATYFPQGVDLSELDKGLLPEYSWLYRILGFPRVERLRFTWRRKFGR